MPIYSDCGSVGKLVCYFLRWFCILFHAADWKWSFYVGQQLFVLEIQERVGIIRAIQMESGLQIFTCFLLHYFLKFLTQSPTSIGHYFSSFVQHESIMDCSDLGKSISGVSNKGCWSASSKARKNWSFEEKNIWHAQFFKSYFSDCLSLGQNFTLTEVHVLTE